MVCLDFISDCFGFISFSFANVTSQVKEVGAGFLHRSDGKSEIYFDKV